MVGGGEGNNSHYLWSSPNTRHCITIHVYYLICTRQSFAVGISKALILQMRKWRPKELTQGHTSKQPLSQKDHATFNLWTRATTDSNTMALSTRVG